MDIYHVWVDLKPGVKDLEFCDAAAAYFGHLRDEGEIAGFRITRRKLGFGPPGLGDFHLMIETEDMAQLEQAFRRVAARTSPAEGFHAAVNQKVVNFTAALYRDFPDEFRKRGDEEF